MQITLAVDPLTHILGPEPVQSMWLPLPREVWAPPS